MRVNYKRILSYILIMTILLGNTVTASAAEGSINDTKAFSQKALYSSMVEYVTENDTSEAISSEEASEAGLALSEEETSEATTGQPETETNEDINGEDATEESETEAGTTEENDTEESSSEEVTEEESTTAAVEETAEPTSTEEVTTEQETETSVEETTTETEIATEMLMAEEMSEADNENTGNVELYVSQTKEGEYEKMGSFATLQDALEAIEETDRTDWFYRIELVSAEENIVTFSTKTLRMPKKAAGIFITAAEELTEPTLYLKGTLKLNTDVTFEDMVFVLTGKVSFALADYELTLDKCRVDEVNGEMLSSISGSGIRGNSKLILRDTKLHTGGAINNVGTLVFAGETASYNAMENNAMQMEEGRLEGALPVISALHANGKVQVGNVELETDGYLSGFSTVTRKNGRITKIVPQITIGGEIFSDDERTLYLDLTEKMDGEYKRVDLNKEEAADILKKGISFAMAKAVTYPHVKSAQRNEADELVKAAGYLKYYDSGYGVILSYTEDETEQYIPCYTFADAVTEINNRKIKQDYVITLTKDSPIVSGTRQDVLNVAPTALKMPDKRYVRTLTIQADPESEENIALGFIGNITFTSDTLVHGVDFVQMMKSGSRYVSSDAAKDGFGTAVTVKTGGFSLTIDEKVTFNTPLVLNGGNKGNLIFNRDSYIHTITNDWEAEEGNRNIHIFGSLTGIGELVLNGQDLTLSEYRNKRNGSNYVASVNKIRTLTLQDSDFEVNGRKKENALTVTNLSVDNSAVRVGGKAVLTNVTLLGSRKALISADTTFMITGTLTTKSNNATLLTRLKGSGKAPYLNITGKVVREKGVLPIYVGVYPENKAADKVRDMAVQLKDAPKVSAQLLTAKKALASDFRPIAENYPWGSGEYNKDNHSGYMMMKSGGNVYVYEGEKVKVAVYAKEENETEDGELFGYFSSLKAATAEVNRVKDKSMVYTYVLMEPNGTVNAPISLALPTYAKQVIVKGYEGSSSGVRTLIFSGGVTLRADTVFEDIILSPVKKAKATTFTLNAQNKGLTLINTNLPGSITKAGRVTVWGDCEVTGSLEAAVLQLQNDKEGNASVVSVQGAVKVTNIENSGDKANVLEYKRTSQNKTQLTINGVILNENTDRPLVIRQNHTKAIPVVFKNGVTVTLKDSYKLAVMPQASTDSFVLEAAAADMDGGEISSENLRVIKAAKGIYQIDIRDKDLEGHCVLLQSTSEGVLTETYCLDYNQAVSEINNRRNRTAEYKIALGTDENGMVDTNITDGNAFSAFPLPKKNTEKSLMIEPKDGIEAIVAFTGNLTGFGAVSMKNLVLQPMKGGNNGNPGNVAITISGDATGASLHLERITTTQQRLAAQTKQGYISNIKGTKNKTEVTLKQCEDMLLPGGISNVKHLALQGTELLTAKPSSVTKLTLGDSASWISLAQLILTDVEAQKGITESYVGVKQNGKGLPQFTLNGNVTEGTLLIRVFEGSTSISEGMKVFGAETEKEAESYFNLPLVLAKKAEAERIRAYAYRAVDENGTITENADGVNAQNFASYKDGNYVKNGTQDAMFMTFGSLELKQFASLAKEELEQLAKEKELYALIYLTEAYEVKEEPSHESDTAVTLPSAHTVQVLGMDTEWYFSEELREYIPIIWYYVQFYVGETLYQGYVEEEFLAYSDELLLQWKQDWSMLFPLKNTLFAYENSMAYSDVNQFPASYQGALEELKDKHPNWTFVPMNVGRDWDDCVDEQMGDYSWIYYNQPAEFRGEKINSTWYYASRAGIEYYMDPRNFLTESNIFQFEQNTYNASYHTQSALQNFLNGTFMAGKVKGDSQNRTYANVIWNSGKSRGLSPFNLAARVIQEQGVNGTSAMISGTYPGYEGYYNHYNISASGKTDEAVFKSGLSYAKKMGWNTRVKSLDGGAAFIGNGYILQGQDTLYLQKFDVNHGSSSLHQYMQNIMAPYTEGRSMKSMYSEAGSLNSSFVFKIPVFEGMSQEYSLSPTYVKLRKGKTRQLTVTCDGLKVPTGNLTFTSDNTAVATVSDKGVITAVGTGSDVGEIGKATITVAIKDFDKKFKCKVEVYSPLEGIALAIDSNHLYLTENLPDKVPVLENGKTIYVNKEDCIAETTLQVAYNPADTTDSRKVTWMVENPEVVQVIQDDSDVGKAKVIAKAGGSTVITAKVGKFTSSVEVTVRVPMTEAYLKTEENSLTLYAGQKKRINVFYAPYETTDSIEPIWSSSNETVAQVVNGEIVAVGEGSATIYANVGPFVGSQSGIDGLKIKVTVKKYAVSFMDENGAEIISVSGEYGETLGELPNQESLPWSYSEKEGYIFGGWYTEPDGMGYAVDKNTFLHGNMSLYPHLINVAEDFYVKPIGTRNYTGGYVKPDVEVYSGGEQLLEGIEYTVVYANNKEVNGASDTENRPVVKVYGTGAYKGKQYLAYFDILPKDISHTDVTANTLLNTYSGREQQMEPVLYDGSRVLQKNMDYTLSYLENDVESGAYTEAGSYEVLVTGIGNYSGSKRLTITISKRILMSRATVANIADMKFNNGKNYVSEESIGECIPGNVRVTYNGKTLKENVDYTLSYEDNREIGTAKVLVEGMGAFIGTLTKTFRITGTDLSTVNSKGISDADYTGEQVEPELSKLRLVNKKGTLLREGLDYEVTYQKRTGAGRAYVTLSGLNGYSGKVVLSYLVLPYNIAENKQTYPVEGQDGAVVELPAFEIHMDEAAVEYDKAGAKKTVVVSFKGLTLTEGKDYLLTYQNNNALIAGEVTPTVTVIGIGNFTGTVVKNFTVIQKDMSKISMTAKNVAFRNRKGFCFATPVLTDESGRALYAGTDYEKELLYTYETDTILQNGESCSAGSLLSENDIPTVGSKIRVTATGTGNYTGSISCVYEIVE